MIRSKLPSRLCVLWVSAAALVLCLSFVACGQSAKGPDTTGGNVITSPEGTAKSLGAKEALAWLAADAQRIAVDLRAPVDYAAGHLRGAVNLQEGWQQFAIRAQRFFGPKASLCLMGDDPQIAKKVALSAAKLFAQVTWLGGDVASLRKAHAAWAKQKTLSVEATRMQLDAGEALLLDARTAKEYARGHVRGAIFLYPDDFTRQAAFLRKDKSYIVLCEEGWRSSLLVSWLDRQGFGHASNMMTGMKAWRSAGYPVETGTDQRDFR